MLSGRYPSDEFAELRPRVTWDRVAGTITAREGAKRVAIANGGTIPDRGLFGVFLVGAGPGAARVGELDEEMVFESRVGETFVLGASSWRIEEITHDRVLVSPAPGEPGKMPFWKGDRAGRPLELGLAIGRLMHDLLRLPPAAAVDRLTREHDLDARAAENLLQYLRDQIAAAARRARRRRRSSIERVRDELGDWRVCVLSPRGGRIHAPWAMAVGGEDPRGDRRRRRDALGRRRVRGAVSGRGSSRPIRGCCCRIRTKCRRSSSGSSARRRSSRRSSARTPRDRCCCPSGGPGMRAPLWQQRKRAADLLAVASRYGSFPVLLETYRECLRDFFDMPALVATLADVRSRQDPRRDRRFREAVAVCGVAALQLRRQLPLRRRRAARRAPRAGAGGRSGAAARADRRRRAARAARRRLDGRDRARSCSGSIRGTTRRAPTACTTCCSSLGDLTADENRGANGIGADVAGSVGDAGRARAACSPVRDRRRARATSPSRTRRGIATRSACRCRPAFPNRCSQPVPRSARRPRAALRAHARAVHRRRRSRARYGARRRRSPKRCSMRLAAEGRLVEGEFRPGGTRPRVDRRRRAAHAAAPLARQAAARSRAGRSGGARPAWRRRGRASSSAGTAPTRCSTRSSSCRARRCRRRSSRPRSCRRGSTATIPRDLDAVTAAGEVVWVGVEPLGERDGRIALYLADHLSRLLAATRVAQRTTTTDARRRSSNSSARTARRSSARCTRRSAAATRARPSTRCGTWCGRVDHQRHVSRAARVHAGARAARRKQRKRSRPRSARGGWRRRRPKDAGRSCGLEARTNPPTGPPRGRSNCSRATAS